MLRVLLLSTVSFVAAQTLGYDWNGFSASGLGCGSDSGVLNVGLGQSLPPGATGMKVKQIAFAIYGTNSLPAFIQLDGSTATPRLSTSTAVQCCGSGCDLAVQVGVAGYSWYNSPCGQPSCANANKWYYMDFSGTAVGTTEQTGISQATFYNSGGTQIGANMINLGSGSVFFMSYTVIIPSPTPTPSLTKSPVSPSLTASETASTSVSRSVTASGSTDPTDSRSMSASWSTSWTPSVDATDSRSASMTMSASRAPSVTVSPSRAASPVSPSVSPTVTPYLPWFQGLVGCCHNSIDTSVQALNVLTPYPYPNMAINRLAVQFWPLSAGSVTFSVALMNVAGISTPGGTILASTTFTITSPGSFPTFPQQIAVFNDLGPISSYVLGGDVEYALAFYNATPGIMDLVLGVPSLSPYFWDSLMTEPTGSFYSVGETNPPEVTYWYQSTNIAFVAVGAGQAITSSPSASVTTSASATTSLTSSASPTTAVSQSPTASSSSSLSASTDVSQSTSITATASSSSSLSASTDVSQSTSITATASSSSSLSASTDVSQSTSITGSPTSSVSSTSSLSQSHTVSTTTSLSSSSTLTETVSRSSSSSVTESTAASATMSTTGTVTRSSTSSITDSTTVSATASTTGTLSRSSTSSLTTTISQSTDVSTTASSTSSASITASTSTSSSFSSSVSISTGPSQSTSASSSGSISPGVSSSSTITPTPTPTPTPSLSTTTSSHTTYSPSMTVYITSSSSIIASLTSSTSLTLSPSPQSFQQVNNISTAMSATSTPQFMVTAYPTTSPTYSPTQNATLPIIVVDGQATNMTTTNALIGSTLALIIVAVALAAGRYLPAGWAQRFRRMIPQSTIDNFKRDPLGSVTAMVNDPKSILKNVNIQIPDSVKNLSDMVPQSIKDKVVPQKLQELVGIAPSTTVPHIETETSPQPPASSRKIHIAPPPPVRRAITPEPIQEEEEEEEKPVLLEQKDEKPVEVKIEAETATGVVEDGGVVLTESKKEEVPSTILKIDAADLEAVQALLNARNASHVVLK